MDTTLETYGEPAIILEAFVTNTCILETYIMNDSELQSFGT